MARNHHGDGVSRRRFVLAAATAGAAGLAGCSLGGGSGGGPDALSADGSSTVYPITSAGSRLWNGNPPASDEEFWGPGQYGIDTDLNLADYFAGRYGFEPTGTRRRPPFRVKVSLSHSGTGIKGVQEGRVDIGDSSAPVEAELPDASRDVLDKYVDHVVGVDGQPVVVSREVYDAGVTELTGEELKGIYRKDPEITNWSQVGGPDREIAPVGRAEGSGTDTAFRANLFGDPEAPLRSDLTRKGQNQQVKTIVENTDNAVAYLALAFVEPDGPTPPVALEVGGTTYEYGENLGARGYPLSRDLHCYTWEDTSDKEAAFLDMLLSGFGQENCVAANNYFVLPEDRREEERAKLPAR